MLVSWTVQPWQAQLRDQRTSDLSFCLLGERYVFVPYTCCAPCRGVLACALLVCWRSLAAHFATVARQLAPERGCASPRRYIEDGKMKTDYPVIIGGENFGCGSSREHAPVSLGASGDAAMHAASVA